MMNLNKLDKKDTIIILILIIVSLILMRNLINPKKEQNNLLLNPKNIDTTKLSINKKDTFFDIYEEKVNGYEELKDLYNSGFETCFIEFNKIKDILPEKIKESDLKESNKLIEINNKNFISIFEIKNILGNKKFKKLDIGLLKKYDDGFNNLEYVELLIFDNNKNNIDNIEFIKYF